MNLNLSNEQASLLARELTNIIDNDRYFLSPRIRALREICNMIRPEPNANRSRSGNITSRRAADDTADAVR